MAVALQVNASPEGVYINIIDSRDYVRHMGYTYSILLMSLNGKADFSYVFYGDDGNRIALKDAQQDEQGRYCSQDITEVFIYGNDVTIKFFMHYEP